MVKSLSFVLQNSKLTHKSILHLWEILFQFSNKSVVEQYWNELCLTTEVALYHTNLIFQLKKVIDL